MKPTFTKSVIGLAATGFVACLFLFFAPTQLGGSTAYSVTDGISMEPMLHAGDLAVVRKQSSYHVGEVVLYESPILHRPVLHRIIFIQNGHYFFKGDNNKFDDPAYATKTALLGALWFHVGSVGKVFSWVGKPVHSALIGALAVVLLFGGIFRRRRRHGEPSGLSMRIATTRVTAATHSHGLLAVAGVGVLVAAVAMLAGVTAPRKRVEQRPGAYTQSVAFSYSARTNKPSSAYAGGLVQTGDPIFLALVHSLYLSVRYEFRSALPHDVRGTIALRAQMSSSAAGWHRVYTLVKPQAFDNKLDIAGVSTTLDLRGLTSLLRDLGTDAGTVGDQYTVALQTFVHVRGFVGSKTIDEEFDPILPMTVTQSAVRLADPVSTAPPVVGAVPPSSDQLLAAELNPSISGSVPVVVANHVHLGPLHPTATALREFAAIEGMLAVALLLFTATARRGRKPPPEEIRVALRHGCVLVHVETLPATDSPAMEVSDLLSLVRLALYRLRPVLVTPEPLYAVDDDTSRFVYRPREAEAPEVAPHVRVPRPHSQRRMLARLAVLVVVLGGLAGVASSFTASNTVPPSNVGASSFARTLAQIAPAACSGITLTNLVVATGSTTTGTAANDLILGLSGSGSFKYDGSGGDDCIVAGGTSATTNTLDGSTGTGDVCLAPAAAKNTFKNCETHS